jgi:hypothetical protein
MKKNYFPLFSLLFLAAVIGLSYYTLMPQWGATTEKPLSEFSTKRALAQVAVLSKKAHYVGAENHKNVGLYLESELQKLGLKPQIQEGYTLSDFGTLVKSRNIMARINGTDNTKALLLLSHYDSAPHSKSLGAGDDGSGIATILEVLRAFLYNKTPHKNDIIILFTDAEELGLNGAALFVTQHQWAKEIRLVLNFEARGTSGPSYMLMEVNKGNQDLVRAFAAAKVPFPASNSLMYSIYKMLPNDTDLTVFREEGKIQGLNFAFIDDHFNYHTQQDDLQHLNPNTLAHQGTYLMPLLQYFSNSNLTTLNAKADDVYFNIPFCFVNYPFSWVLPMLFVLIGFFGLLVFIGFGKRILNRKAISKGFLLFLGYLVTVGLVGFFGWKMLLHFYPQYLDILHGFTYNGHYYITAFVFLCLAIGFLFYSPTVAEKETMNYAVAPLFVWILIYAGIALLLPGAGFFMIPVMTSLLGFSYFILTQKPNKTVSLLMSVPAILVFVPFITMFPIGLGLKIMYGSLLLVGLVFGLLLPVFGAFSKKGLWALFLFVVSIIFFVQAHVNSEYQYGKAKPNSLVYLLDADAKKATWTTYDVNLDEWTKKYLGENPKEVSGDNQNPLYSKYHSKFTFSNAAPLKAIPKPTIAFLTDSVAGSQRYFKIRITPNRNVNRYDVFANEQMNLNHFYANGVKEIGQTETRYHRTSKKVLTYYVVDNAPLEMQFSIDIKSIFDMDVMESSFDLLENPQFHIEKRAPWMMPTPFVLNDAIIIKQKIKPGTPPVSSTTVAPKKKLLNVPTNDTIQHTNGKY